MLNFHYSILNQKNKEGVNMKFDFYKNPFYEGQRVILNPLWNKFDSWLKESEGNVGTIITSQIALDELYNHGKITEKTWIEVRWDNGYSDSYECGALLPKEAITQKEKSNNIEFPILPGQKICLNPEGKRYQTLLNITNNELTGYVVNILLSEKELIKWKTTQYKNYAIKVKFNNTKGIFTLYNNDILPINTPPINIIAYYLSDGSTYFTFENSTFENDETFNILDKKILIHGIQITQIKHFNNTWREKILKAIAES